MPEQSSSRLIWFAAALVIFLIVRHGDIGRQAPDFNLQGAYGGAYHLDSFRGKPLLLVFWSTSCGICRHELPVLDTLQGEASKTGVQIACVNIGDVDGAREVMRPLHMLNLVDADGRAAQSYGVSGVPKLVMIGADGKIKHSSSGMVPEDDLREWMR